MQDMTAKSWTKTWEDWPGHVRGLFGPRSDDEEVEPPQEQLPRAERRLLGLVALGFAVILAWWWWDRGPEVKVVAVNIGNAAEVVYATGIVEPVNWAKVTAPSRKRIVEICKCEGEPVKKGQVLVRLDDEEERAVLSEYETRLARYKEDAARLETLVKRNSVSRVTLDDKLTQVREYEARVAMQKDRISDLALTSPLDGIVMRRIGEVGEIAGVGERDTLLWVGEPSPLKIIAEVNEDDILKVAPGQKVLLRHEGHQGAPLPATVERITPKGDPETKTFRVHLLLPEDTPLKVGMSVEANIVVAEATDALIVPAEAVSNGHVLKVENGAVKAVPVEIAVRGTDRLALRGALAAGDLVVSPAPADLKDGASVRPVRADQEGP
jgi:membrane fusion protein, multidrug efflux system